MAFSDVDFDGSVDLVCMSEDSITIYFNKFGKDSDSLCSLQSEDFPFDDKYNSVKNENYFVNF